MAEVKAESKEITYKALDVQKVTNLPIKKHAILFLQIYWYDNSINNDDVLSIYKNWVTIGKENKTGQKLDKNGFISLLDKLDTISCVKEFKTKLNNDNNIELNDKITLIEGLWYFYNCKDYFMKTYIEFNKKPTVESVNYRNILIEQKKFNYENDSLLRKKTELEGQIKVAKQIKVMGLKMELKKIEDDIRKDEIPRKKRIQNMNKKVKNAEILADEEPTKDKATKWFKDNI